MVIQDENSMTKRKNIGTSNVDDVYKGNPSVGKDKIENRIFSIPSPTYVRQILIIEILVLIAVGLIGLKVNDGKKYVRIVDTENNCHKAWVDIIKGDIDSHDKHCCYRGSKESLNHSDLCVAAMDDITATLESLLALLLPLLPLLLTSLFYTTFQFLDTKDQSLMTKLWSKRRNRMILYFLIILTRTGLLFKGLNALQDHVQGEEETTCWYAHMRKNKSCRENFDFADHLVLFICHYVTIPTVELLATVSETKLLSNFMTKEARPWKFGAYLSNLFSIAIIGLSLRSSFYTLSYFHSPLESIVGTALAITFVYLPTMYMLVYQKDAYSYFVHY